MKKKILAFLFVTVLLLGLFSVPSLAETVQDPVVQPPQYRSSGPHRAVLANFVDVDELRSFLIEELASCPAELDISSFGLPCDEAVLIALVTYMDKETPELFHCIPERYSYNDTTILTLELSYTCTSEEYAKMWSDCVKAADEILKGVEGNDSLSPMEKALLLHDRLALWCRYDESLSKEYIYDIYGVLVNRIAVCEGYAKAYSYLLDRCGIPNHFCSSDLLEHAWNVLYLDGVPYHVDATWDDPLPDLSGQVFHDNFLRSTEGMKETEHHANGLVDYDSSPTDTRFDEAVWQSSTASVQLLKDEVYFIDNKNQTLCLLNGDQAEEILSVEDQWLVNSDYAWVGNFAKLATDGTYLLFNLSDGIYAYDPVHDHLECVFTAEFDDPYSQGIYSFVLQGSNLSYQVGTTPGFDGTNYTLRTAPYTAPALQHHYDSALDADCNDCGSFRPLLLLEKAPRKTSYLFGEEVDLTGLEVIYSDENGVQTKLDPSVLTVSGFDSCKGERQKVTVSYKGVETSFYVNVSATLTVESLVACPGDLIEVALRMDGAVSFQTLTVSDLRFDSEALTFVSARWKDEENLTVAQWNEVGSGTASYSENRDYNGVVAYLTFQVKEGIEKADVSVSCKVKAETKPVAGAIFSEEVLLVPIEGKIRIRNYVIGDLNGDEKVTSEDVLYLLYSALFGETRYPLLQDCDFDLNGNVTAEDAAYLLYFTLFGEARFPLRT